MSKLQFDGVFIQTVAQFAEEKNLTAQTMKRYVDKYNELAGDNGKVKPITTLGVAVYFNVTDLEVVHNAMKREAKPNKVDPEQHQEVVERAQRLANESARLSIENRNLQLKLDRIIAAWNSLNESGDVGDIGTADEILKGVYLETVDY